MTAADNHLDDLITDAQTALEETHPEPPVGADWHWPLDMQPPRWEDEP